MGDVLLKAEGISKQFVRGGNGSGRSFNAVAETDFCLEAGKLVELVGRSGSGKSTMLNILSGLLQPTTGQVFFGDKDLYALDDKELSRLRNEHFGMVPQGQTALYSLNVLENVKMPYLLNGREDDIDEYARKLLADLAIGDLADVYPAELSGGEMRRMAIARALICKPSVLFADEPTGDLDDENTEAVFQVLRKVADEGAAVMLVTHEASAADYADVLYKMDAGKLSAQ